MRCSLSRRSQGHELPCLDQFYALAFAHPSACRSLRDTAACLQAMQPRLYHVGFRGKISRNNFAHANECRDWRIYADLAQVFIGQVRPLYRDDSFALDLDHTAYALDATTIDICLTLCPWAPFQKSRAAIKLQTLLDLRGSIPTLVFITHGRVSDKVILDDIVLEMGGFYVMDRGYIHFKRLFQVDSATGLRSNQTVMLTGKHTGRNYPIPIRRVTYFDRASGHRLIFVTNNFALPALTIAQLYKSRWQIELFVKWIKQHLQIQSFYGTSANAVKTQIWTAISLYLFKKAGPDGESLHNFATRRAHPF